MGKGTWIFATFRWIQLLWRTLIPLLGLKILRKQQEVLILEQLHSSPFNLFRKMFENKSRTINSVLPEEHDLHNPLFTLFLPHNTSSSLFLYVSCLHSQHILLPLLYYLLSHSHVTHIHHTTQYFFPSRTAPFHHTNTQPFFPLLSSNTTFTLCYVFSLHSHHVLSTQHNIFFTENSKQSSLH